MASSAVSFNINTEKVVALTVKLNEMHRSAFPVAVRTALNNAAFDVKQNTLEKSASNNFIRRQPNFFKRFSGVNPAVGFNVGTMKATVGMTAMGQVTAATAIEHMNQQEAGGGITSGTDYLKGARGGNNASRVRKANYLSNSNVLHGPFRRKGTMKSNFMAMAYASLKTGKMMKFKSASGKTFYSQVTNMQTGFRGKRKGILKIRSKLIIEKRGTVGIRATHFSREAAMMTYAKMEGYYIAAAEKQFATVWK